MSHPARRMLLPAYQVADAARYAGVSTATIHYWQRAQKEFAPALAKREIGASLSFLQLVELRFVAAMRETGLKLSKIRAAREYLAQQFKTEYPFADLRLKYDAQNILVDLEEEEGPAYRGTMLVADAGGQYAWKAVIGDKFQEFEYDGNLARRWHVQGKLSPVIIDPNVAFGAPQVRGVPTWVLKNRHDGGESTNEMARDFRLTIKLVKEALAFENSVNKNKRKPKAWMN